MSMLKKSFSFVSAVSVASMGTAFAEDFPFEDDLFAEDGLLELNERPMSAKELGDARGGFSIGGLTFNIGVIIPPPAVDPLPNGVFGDSGGPLPNGGPFGEGGVFGDSGGPLPNGPFGDNGAPASNAASNAQNAASNAQGNPQPPATGLIAAITPPASPPPSTNNTPAVSQPATPPNSNSASQATQIASTAPASNPAPTQSVPTQSTPAPSTPAPTPPAAQSTPSAPAPTPSAPTSIASNPTPAPTQVESNPAPTTPTPSAPSTPDPVSPAPVVVADAGPTQQQPLPTQQSSAPTQNATPPQNTSSTPAPSTNAPTGGSGGGSVQPMLVVADNSGNAADEQSNVASTPQTDAANGIHEVPNGYYSTINNTLDNVVLSQQVTMQVEVSGYDFQMGLTRTMNYTSQLVGQSAMLGGLF
ncbi:hypothetical protein ABFZ85_01160 [Hyphococcus formosus]|uniref:hypothetical protein n=1 Tax=Hyphococcus formosus TaxID=3143534 RepID=UPI00398A856C